MRCVSCPDVERAKYKGRLQGFYITGVVFVAAILVRWGLWELLVVQP